MPAGAALVDALRQVAHLGDAVADLLAQQHAAAAGLGALPDDDFDRVGLAQVIRVHAVARRQVLVDESLRSGRAPRASCRRRRSSCWCPSRSHRGRAPPWPGADSAPKLMPAMVIGIFSSIGFFAKRVPSVTLGVAASRGSPPAGSATCDAPRNSRSSKCGHLALGAETADVVDALARGALDLRDHVAAETSPIRAGGLLEFCGHSWSRS